MKILAVESVIKKNYETDCFESFYINDENTLTEAREQTKKIIAKKLIKLRKQVTDLFGPQFSEDVITAIINRVMVLHENVRVMDPCKPSH